MIHGNGGSEKDTLSTLDPISRATLFRIAFMVLAIGLWFGYGGQISTDDALASVMTASAIITAVTAAALREPFCGSSLNRWDETLTYIGLSSLAHLMS
jgi:hypothetical protein